MKIITFGCQKNIFIYTESSLYTPAYPYKIHRSIDKAVQYQKERGIDNPKIVYC